MKTAVCQVCEKSFIIGPGSIGKFCSRSCTAKYGNSIRKPKIRLHDASCLECSKPIYKPNKFCSKSCSAIHNNRLRPAGHPSRISPNSNRGKNQREKIVSKVSWCKICGHLIKNSKRITCSTTCKHISFQDGGKKSSLLKTRRSKDEIKLFELCKSHYHSVRHNEPLVEGWDADIIIDDIRTAILWNGPWHYKQMLGLNNHSLKQVQNRDKIKINLLESAGWKVMIFEDRHYNPESAFQIILAGDGIEPS